MPELAKRMLGRTGLPMTTLGFGALELLIVTSERQDTLAGDHLEPTLRHAFQGTRFTGLFRAVLGTR